jgi:hypothetical protein
MRLQAPQRPDRTRRYGTRPDQTGPDRSTSNQTEPDGSRRYKTGPDRTRPDQMGPGRTRPDGSRWDKTGPDGTRWDQTGPDGTRRDKTGPGGARPDQTAHSPEALVQCLRHATLCSTRRASSSVKQRTECISAQGKAEFGESCLCVACRWGSVSNIIEQISQDDVS